nr:potassium-transporting ATPase subunit KdpC [Fundidesulfovibrio agrisoli]
MQQLRPAALMLFWMTLLTGLAYPLAMTGLGAALFPAQAGGSLIVTGGGVAGSALIGQPFASDAYFHGRPSATAPYEYNAGASSGSNLGPSNPALPEAVAGRVAALDGGGPAPMDLVTASASGLDPHVSPEGAARQLGRVARARNMPPETVAALVAAHTEGRLFGFWGEPRVNVLELNLALDAAGKKE